MSSSSSSPNFDPAILVTYNLEPGSLVVPDDEPAAVTGTSVDALGLDGPSWECGGAMGWVVPTIDGLLMIGILSGNSLTVLAILRKPRLATASNQFVCSLAAADMVVGLTMPYHMAFYLCASLGVLRGPCLLRFVLIILACCASVYHLIAIAVDRYLAIVHPLRHAAIVTKRVARKVIALGWLLSVFVSTIPLYWNTWHKDITSCEIVEVIPRDFIILVVLPVFIFLSFIMLLTYARIQRVAASQARRLSGQFSPVHLHAGRKSLQVVSLVLGCFCLCWLPFLTIVTVLVFGLGSPGLHLAYKLAFSFAMANSCMNPVIYAWKNCEFKAAFREMLHCGDKREGSLDTNSAPICTLTPPAEEARSVHEMEEGTTSLGVTQLTSVVIPRN